MQVFCGFQAECSTVLNTCSTRCRALNSVSSRGGLAQQCVERLGHTRASHVELKSNSSNQPTKSLASLNRFCQKTHQTLCAEL